METTCLINTSVISCVQDKSESHSSSFLHRKGIYLYCCKSGLQGNKSPCLALVPLAAVLPGGGGLELGEAEAGVVSVQQRAVETLVAVEVARERELFTITILGTRYMYLNLQNLRQQDLKSSKPFKLS